MKVVVLANGKFPEHKIPLQFLKYANVLVCCDGSTASLNNYGFEPTAIVGDLDSVTDDLKEKYADRLFFSPDQDTNDLTKAIHWCKRRGFEDVTILAGTGKRDDHTMGNIGLLPSYKRLGINVKMVTDYGILVPLLSSAVLESYEGQQVSIFSFNTLTRITTRNLKYPIENGQLTEPWMGTLNQSLGSWFELKFEPGPLVVFLSHKP